MSGRLLLLGTCAAVVLAGGYWLGRSSSSPAPHATPNVAVRTASLPVVTIAPSIAAPALKPTRAADPTLAADLVNSDPKIRRAALHEAVRDPDVDVQVLLTASHDSDLEVAGVATIALGNAYARGDVAVSEMVARAQDRSLDEKVRFSAVNGLGKVASPEAIALLSELAHGAPSERASAAILLRNQNLAGAVPVLIGLLADDDAHVRESAHDSLTSRARGRDFGGDRAAWQAWWSSTR